MSTDHTGEPDFFKKSMKLLKENHPHVWEMMTKNPPEPEGEIILAPNGEPNLWTNDINGNRVSLHIPENPGIEINDLSKAVNENFNGTLIITGMGLGYCPLALIKKRKNLRHLVIFEPNPGIFFQAIKAMDLSILFSDPRVILGIGEKQNIAATMGPATKALQLENIQHIQHKPSFSLDLQKYSTLYQEINNHTNASNLEGNTFMNMGDAFFTNRLKHLNSIHHNYTFDDLKNKFQDIPAILVSAGPSLDKSIKILKKAKGRAIILCVDSALPSLVNNNIMPDFVTTIDPLELIFEKVAKVTNKVSDISLICMSWASSKMAKLFPASKVFWCFGGKIIEHWMANLVGCKTLTGGASSVAHLNFLSATFMGCSPIIFVGQDLSYSQSKSHASHMTLQVKDRVNELLKNKKDVVWLEGLDGNKVPSNRNFSHLKVYLETMIKQNKGHYINSTERGANIEGTEVMPLQEVIDRFCTSTIDAKSISDVSIKNNPVALREHLTYELQKKIKRCQQINKMLNETTQLLKELLKALNKAKNSKTIYKTFNDLSHSNQKKILKLDKIGKKLDDATDIWPLMQEVTMAGLKLSEQQKYAINLIANDLEKYAEWLKKSFQHLDNINKVRKKVLPLLQDTLQDDIDFLKAEASLLTTLDKHEDREKYSQQLLKLVTLYFGAGNIALAQPLLEELSQTMPDSAAINFFQGITAAHYTQYDKAESFFKKAIKADSSYISQIEEFRILQGNAYISYAQFFKDRDKTVSRRLLLKGLIYAPDHENIKKELKIRSAQTLKEIKNLEKEKTLPEAEDMIDNWLDDLSSTRALSSIIGEETAAELYYYKGIISVDKEKWEAGIEHFNKALDIIPDNPVFHISLTDAYFAKDDYTKGIEHLNQAVSLDKAYAVYFEEIGDELIKANQHDDAIIAFENCFVALPERVHLLKKIGDCYQKTGQLDAAREAYTKLNSLLKKS